MEAKAGGEPVRIVCLGGVELGARCSIVSGAGLGEAEKSASLVAEVLGEHGGPVLVVSPSLRGAGRFFRELGELGANPFMVEVTGVPEAIVSGLTLEQLVDYWSGMLVATLADRGRARPRPRHVTRRDALRRLLVLVPREYVVTPVPRVSGLPGECRSACPYNALGDGVDEQRCLGCMLCIHRCPGVFEEPRWTGVAGLLYAYTYLSSHGLDGILFICRERLDHLDERAAEPTPARLLPYHTPCNTWLSPQLLSRLAQRLGVPAYVYAGPAVCSGCRLADAMREHSEALRQAGVAVVESLAEASAIAYTGYTRQKHDLEEAAKLLLGED